MWSCFIIYMIFCTYAACFFYYLFMLIYKNHPFFIALLCSSTWINHINVSISPSDWFVYYFFSITITVKIFLYTCLMMWCFLYGSYLEVNQMYIFTPLGFARMLSKVAVPSLHSLLFYILPAFAVTFLNCCQSNGYNGILFWFAFPNVCLHIFVIQVFSSVTFCTLPIFYLGVFFLADFRFLHMPSN